MRKLVKTISIMLPVLFLFIPPGNIVVASASGTQNTPKFTPTTLNPLIRLSTNSTHSFCPTKDAKDVTIPAKIALTEKKLFVIPEPAEQLTDLHEVASFEQELVVPQAAIPPSEDISASAAANPLYEVPTAPQSTESSGVLNAEVIFSMVNTIRINAGLSPFEKHPEVCAIVQSRAPELDNEIYGRSYMHAGFHSRDLPFRATENMISQQTEQEAVNWWMNSAVHRSALLGSYKYACVACQGKSCAMIFSNLQPK
jgi:hypothetical protein